MSELRYQDFLRKIVEDATEVVKRDYNLPSQKHELEGALAGLKACLDKSPPQLAVLHSRACRALGNAFHNTDIRRYYRIACFRAEVEWVCNVVSAALVNMDQPAIIQPTMRGLMKAAEIVNGNN